MCNLLKDIDNCSGVARSNNVLSFYKFVSRTNNSKIHQPSEFPRWDKMESAKFLKTSPFQILCFLSFLGQCNVKKALGPGI